MEDFRFKRFKVSHGQSSMKVGADAVLLGAWAPALMPRKILDVGTGCGLIALMLAQRFPDARILAIDIHEPSVAEAALNFANSPWPCRLEARLAEFPLGIIDKKFDLIVSNPPFFDAGVASPASPREIARHVGSLSPLVLIQNAVHLLNPGGSLAMIFPADSLEKILREAEKRENELQIEKICKVRNNPGRPWRRVMASFQRSFNNSNLSPSGDSSHRSDSSHVEISWLTLMENNQRSPQYQSLTHDFYL